MIIIFIIKEIDILQERYSLCELCLRTSFGRNRIFQAFKKKKKILRFLGILIFCLPFF